MIKKFRTYEVDVLISHCVHAEVEKENNLHSIQREHRTNSERYMEVERGRNHRRKSDGGSYPFANINTAEDIRIEFHVVSEWEEAELVTPIPITMGESAGIDISSKHS